VTTAFDLFVVALSLRLFNEISILIAVSDFAMPEIREFKRRAKSISVDVDEALQFEFAYFMSQL
jgi:hypothetical protein